MKNYNNAFRKVIIVRKLLSVNFLKQNYEKIDLVNGVRSLHLDIHGHEEGEEEENPAGQSQQFAGGELSVGTNLRQQRI